MHLNEKRLAVNYGVEVSLQFNGWEISGQVENVTSDDKVSINGRYYDLRACRYVRSDYNRSMAIAAENRLRQEGGVLA